MNTSIHTPSARRLGGLLPLLLLAVPLACSGASTVTDGSSIGETDRTAPATDLTATEGGPSQIVLSGGVQGLAVGDLVELVPRGPWPSGDAARPGQAMLIVTGVDGREAHAAVIGQRTPSTDLEDLQGRVATSPTLPLSKSVTTVLSRNARNVRLDASAPEGVFPGDYFFVLGDPETEPQRLGSRIIALLRVQGVTATGSDAVVVHQMADFDAGALALFAHHSSLTAERPEALILFARTNPGAAYDPAVLPPLAEAVVDYQFEFRFSNIRIETLDQYIDPSAYDAPEQAVQLAPDEGFGVIVFGQERDGDFLYNITTYGTSPSLATTVGILPGGLPLPTPEGLQGLSTDLAPSFLATAMTQRGDDAETIYFLEYCLRNRDIEESVAFHLREHLALRYEGIGRPLEGLWLMDHDIAVARESDNPYAELNALSIREYLHRSLFRYEEELADLEAFLDVADDVLPDESLLAERLERGRVLGRLEEYDEAFGVIDDVIRQAQSQESLRWEVSASLARASLLFETQGPDAAIQAVNSTLPDARLIEEPGDHSFARYCHALLAQYYVELADREEALTHLRSAIGYASREESRYPLASMFELAATVYYNLDSIPEAVANMREAARIYGELDQFVDTARALLQAGMLEMRAAVINADFRYLEAAYDHLDRAAQAYLTIGDGSWAAQAYGGTGLVNSLMRNSAQASANLTRMVELAHAYNDPETVTSGYLRLAELSSAMGNIDQAQTSLQTARLWAAAFEYSELMEEIDAFESSIRSDI